MYRDAVSFRRDFRPVMFRERRTRFDRSEAHRFGLAAQGVPVKRASCRFGQHSNG
jgi:hypothetical protein